MTFETIIEFEKLDALLNTRLPGCSELWNVRNYCRSGLYSEYVQTTFYSLGGVINEFCVIVCVLRRAFPLDTDLLVMLSGPVSVEEIPDDASTSLEAIIDWSVRVAFAGVERELVEKLKLRELCISNGLLRLCNPCDTLFLPMDLTHLLIITPEENVVVKHLDVCEAENMVSTRKFPGPGTLERKQDEVATIGSAGVYVSQGQEGKGNAFMLVTWVVVNHDGAIGALQTMDNHRGKGYGKLVMKWISKYCIDRGWIPTVHIEEKNSESKALMEKIGYQFLHKVFWVFYEPHRNA